MTTEIAMTTELWMLFWSVVLTFVQVVVAVMGANFAVSLPTLAGNRDDMPSISGWAGRAQRAHRNMLESLPLFAALVLIVHAVGAGNDTTALGAQIFLFARVAYAVVYVIGIPWVRTVCWFVAVIGMIMVALALL